MKRRVIFMMIFSSLVLSHQAPAIAQDQTAATAPCDASEFRQLDLWLGDWDLSWDLAKGKTGQGRNIIDRSKYGKCVVTENFSMPGFTGMSVSTYDAKLEKWRQTWVDDQGGYYALLGGAVEGKAYEFELVVTRHSSEDPHLRMIWQDVEKNALTWRWQKRDKDLQWNDLWVINYKRRKT